MTRALEVIRAELDTTMALCGEKRVHALGRQNVMLPQGFLSEYGA